MRNLVFLCAAASRNYLAAHTRRTAYNIRSAAHPPNVVQQIVRGASSGDPSYRPKSSVCADDTVAAFRYALIWGKVSSQIHDHNEESVNMADKTGKTDVTSIVASPVTGTETATVADKKSKAKPKRMSKSERTHQRRVKQAARKPGAALS